MIITLLDGTQVDTNDVVFDSGSYTFNYGDQDISSLITQADKLNNWSDFDPKTASLFAYNKQQTQAGLASNIVDPFDTSGAGTSTLGNFASQIVTDPLAAPLESADKELTTITTNTAKSILSSYTGLIILAVVGIYLWLKFKK